MKHIVNLLKNIYYKLQIILAIQMSKPFFMFKVYIPGMGLFLVDYSVFLHPPLMLDDGYFIPGDELNRRFPEMFGPDYLDDIVQVIREYPDQCTMIKVLDNVQDQYDIPYNRAYALINTLIQYTLNSDGTPSHDTNLIYHMVTRQYWNEWSHMPRFNFPMIQYTYHHKPCPILITKALLPVSYYTEHDLFNPMKNLQLVQGVKSSVSCTTQGYQYHPEFSISARKFHYEMSGAHLVDLIRAVSGKNGYTRALNW